MSVIELDTTEIRESERGPVNLHSMQIVGGRLTNANACCENLTVLLLLCYTHSYPTLRCEISVSSVVRLRAEQWRKSFLRDIQKHKRSETRKDSLLQHAVRVGE